MTKLSSQIKRKITEYDPKGGLGHTSSLFLSLAEVSHKDTRAHTERVALLCDAVARKLRKDYKAAFFAGLLHDIGKMLLPNTLFDGHTISDEEYSTIKTHALSGFKALKKHHYFTALCAGLHHNLYHSGYGLSSKYFPEKWSPATIKKVLDISIIVSICDFIDAFTSRKTKIRDGSDNKNSDLKDMLYQKYPDEKLIIDTALKCYYENT